MINLSKLFKVAVLSMLTLAGPIGQVANALPPGETSAGTGVNLRVRPRAHIYSIDRGDGGELHLIETTENLVGNEVVVTGSEFAELGFFSIHPPGSPNDRRIISYSDLEKLNGTEVDHQWLIDTCESAAQEAAAADVPVPGRAPLSAPQLSPKPPGTSRDLTVDEADAHLRDVLAALDPDSIPDPREVGKGAFGIVKKFSVTVGTGICEVAVKRFQLNPDLQNLDPRANGFSSVMDRYRVEHPNLVKTLRAIEPNSERGPTIFTAYYPLGNLNARLREWATQQPRERFNQQVSIVCSIANGLKALHANGLFHGYLKPTNILLSSDFDASLTDYMVWALQRLDLTCLTTMVVPCYRDPNEGELVEEKFSFDYANLISQLHGVDMYSFGLICYEILTLKPGFAPSEGLLQVMKRSRSSSRPPIPESINPEFGQLIQRCWNQKPSARPTITDVWDTMVRLNFEIMVGVDGRAVIAHFPLPIPRQQLKVVDKPGDVEVPKTEDLREPEIPDHIEAALPADSGRLALMTEELFAAAEEGKDVSIPCKI
jgi:serine/threonine protein kinase